MGISEVLVDGNVLAVLGEDGIRAACCHLHPEDCQVCGKPLGGVTPQLEVEEFPALYAILRHASCGPANMRFPYGLHVLRGGNTVTWAATSVTMTVVVGITPPVIILNPGLEWVYLTRDSEGQWRVRPDGHFPDAGLTVAGPGFVFSSRTAARATIGPLTDAIDLRIGFQTYRVPARPNFLAAVDSYDGCFLIATHALKPSRIVDWDEVFSAIKSGRTAIGWVRLPRRATPGPADAGPGSL
ncbi:hypothetical protein [Micromonospora sp. NPDC003776]